MIEESLQDVFRRSFERRMKIMTPGSFGHENMIRLLVELRDLLRASRWYNDVAVGRA